MEGTIRPAVKDDVPAIAALADARRQQYQRYQPRFWRPAADARERHEPFLEQLVTGDRAIVLVHERDHTVDGFVIAQIVPTPPVYDAGGPTCSIDDFWIAADAGWLVAGRALLEAAMTEARTQGAMQTVVVCAYLDEPKRAMLAEIGYTPASIWYVRDN
ncbi:MAG: hypothetical protein OJF49_002381 [Ktedonobacterales bacterium]|jgi:GNAT superfamily N-acetyltransferase|nr:MAG: hypothetical protein OJF49_002381 [Ktedonobacterales bacterium]